LGQNEVGKASIGKNLIYSNSDAPLTVELASVHGNLLANSNSGSILVFDAFVDGNAIFVANTGGVGVGQTAIGGTLNCEANDPPPVTFGDSADAAHGQCST
jgi:hypothetical protein